MITAASGARIWLALGVTDMRRGMNTLARQVQQSLKADPHSGDMFIFRGMRSNLVKILWADDVGVSLYIKRLEQGQFIWPSATDGVVAISASQMACLLDGIDWRHPRKAWRPSAVG